MGRTAADMPPEQWRSRDARIERLKARLAHARAFGGNDDLCAVLAGILDLLKDEL